MIEALIPLIDFILRIILYYFALKLRKLDSRLITCALCAGASTLVGLLPFPTMLHFVLTIVIAGFFIVKNADAEMFPDGVGIPIATEVAGAFVMRFAVLPLIEIL